MLKKAAFTVLSILLLSGFIASNVKVEANHRYSSNEESKYISTLKEQGTSILLLCGLVIMIILFINNKRLNIKLEKMVGQRTKELENQSESLLRMSYIVNNSPQYISYVNKNGTFHYVNPAANDITGYTREELLEQGIQILYDKETYQMIKDKLIPQIFEQGKLEFELPLIRKDGQKRIMAFSAFVIDASEYSCGTIAMDITEQKRLEQQLIDAKESALQHSYSKSEFLSRMSHEIRTPMNAIIGMTKIAMNTENITLKSDSLKKIDTASTYLLNLINDILDISKIEAGKFELLYDNFDLLKMLEYTRDVFQYRMDEKSIDFRILTEPDLPPFIISDEQRVLQVLTNLIGNAIKFTPENGKITLSVRKLNVQNKTHTIEFEVSDNGIGIPEKYHSKIFQSYEQEDSNIAKKYGGTGLGLSISKHMVELMGGTIRVESKQNLGSQFIFTIQAGEGESLSKSSFSHSEDFSKDFLKGKRILLAEDVEINREIVLTLLEPFDVQLDCAADGLEALKMFHQYGDYDLILMDIHMPELDGYETSKKIRQSENPRAKTIPIIAMTANVFKEDIEKCLFAGMNDHIGKPLLLDDVFTKLKKHLERI